MYLAWTLIAGIPPSLVRFGSIKMTRSEAVTFRRLLLTRFALIPDFNGKPDVPLQPILIAYRKRFVRPRVRLGSIRDSFRVHSGSIREPFRICSGSVHNFKKQKLMKVWKVWKVWNNSNFQTLQKFELVCVESLNYFKLSNISKVWISLSRKFELRF